MKRSALVLAAFALAGGGPASAQSDDAPPTTPGDVRATLYDKAGGELFWERSTDDRGAVVGYEITRNGESLGIRDALSYYDRSLEPGVPYTFTVTAVDNAGQRSSPATATLGAGTAAPPPAGDGPDAPAALRAEVYSKRSLELFWRREPAALALRYEIRRDGEIVGTTDGVSFYTRGLAAGTEYAFEVVAIGRGGERSSPASITVSTPGDGSTAPGPADPVVPPPDGPAEPPPDGPATPPTAGGPDAPAGLRAERYSARSGELFWERPSGGPALRYEVRRDGQPLATTDGVSYYDDTLSDGRRYAYEVVAIDPDGRRSDAADVTLETRNASAPNTAVITANGVDALLGAVIDVIAGRGYVADVLGVRELPRDFGLVTPRGDGVIEARRIVCDNGGTVDFSGRTFPTEIEEAYDFDGCQLDTALFDGRLESNRSPGGNFSTTLLGESLTIDRGDDAIALDGRFDYDSFRVGGVTFRFEGDLDFPLEDDRLVLEDAAFSLSCVFVEPLRLEGTFALTSTATGGRTIRVETETAFVEDPASNVFDRGRLTLSATDGSGAIVDVAGGDARSYTVTVTGNGETAVVTRSLDELRTRIEGNGDLGC